MPPLLVVIEEATTLMLAWMLPASLAVTATAAACVTAPPSSVARAPLETLLEATIAPTAEPLAKYSAPAVESAALLTVALSAARLVAETLTVPVALSVVPVTVASASAGSSPLNAVEISGSPRIASIRLKSALEGL